MKNYQIKHGYNSSILFETEAPSLKEALEIAVKQGVNLQGADLQGADLQGANLSEANLRGAYLYRANLSEANLQGAYLYRANLYRANLQGAYLYRAYLYRANLQYANLSEANIDFSCWPLWCGSANVKIDEKQARQLLYHAFSVSKQFIKPTEEQKEFINQFHRIIDGSCEKL